MRSDQLDSRCGRLFTNSIARALPGLLGVYASSLLVQIETIGIPGDSAGYHEVFADEVWIQLVCIDVRYVRRPN